MATRTSSSVPFLAGGDVTLDRPSARAAFGRPGGLLREAGMAFANLEAALSRRGRPASDKILLRGDPKLVEALLEAGLDLLSFANNHALDYGEEAFLDTLDILKKNAIPSVGGGRNLAEAGRAVVLERGGLRIGALAFCSILPRGFAAGKRSPGVNPLRAETAYQPAVDLAEYPGTAPQIRTWAVPPDLARMRRAVRALRRSVDFLLVNHHWGTSMTHELRDFQREIARATVEAGADLVLGGHPHVLQGVEFHKGAPIVYSMGNLIFDIEVPFFTAATRQTFLLGCDLRKGRVTDPYLIPCRSGVKNAPQILSPAGKEGREIVSLVRRLSEPLGTRLEEAGDRVMLAPVQ